MNINCTYNIVVDEHNNKLVIGCTLNTNTYNLKLTDNFKYRPKRPYREYVRLPTRYNNKGFDCINGALLHPDEVNKYIVMVHYREIMGAIYNENSVDRLMNVYGDLLENWSNMGLSTDQFDILSGKIDSKLFSKELDNSK